MAYVLQALVGAREALHVEGVTVVELRQELGLIPLTDSLRDRLGGRDENVYPETFAYLSAGVEKLALQISERSPVAYVETEQSAGGTEGSVVWVAGQVVSGPNFVDSDTPEGRRVHLLDHPINVALRCLGVERDPASDEFDAVGLGRHRFTEEWLEA